jgi:hypothetical protein
MATNARIGILVPGSFAGTPPTLSEFTTFFQRVDDLGLHSLWVIDRIFHTVNILDPMTLLTCAAAWSQNPCRNLASQSSWGAGLTPCSSAVPRKSMARSLALKVHLRYFARPGRKCAAMPRRVAKPLTLWMPASSCTSASARTASAAARSSGPLLTPITVRNLTWTPTAPLAYLRHAPPGSRASSTPERRLSCSGQPGPMWSR